MKNTDLLRFPNKERLLSSSINPNNNLPIYIEDDQVSRLINLSDLIEHILFLFIFLFS